MKKLIPHLVLFLTILASFNQSVLGMKRGQKENIENNKEQEKRPRQQNTPQHDSPKEYSKNPQPGPDIFKNNIWGGHSKK